MILRSEWLGELARDQVIANKEHIGTKEFTAYQTVSKLAT
jgi:hypothetical protein